jgi:stearoyl-CoA desaturase (delta-9 desaturase)
LILTHITIASVTIFLHRHQAHRALTLHPLVSHFFRFWLWLTTGMVTREWVAVHRKHHAKVESPEDPHSPQQQGINRILWLGVLAYRKAATDSATIKRYGFETPDDWIERNLYAARPTLGLITMFAIDVALFGTAGLAIWVMQMLWIPFWAAGVINGIGHFWGYRNYEVRDASTNIVPWGFIIGGEELHNNHHAFGSSAKFSTKWWEFDLGWVYIRLLEFLGLARVKKVAPRLTLVADKQRCDLETVRAVITSRFHVMSNFSREVVKRVCREELHKLDRSDRERWALMKRARRLLGREATLLDETSRRWLNTALDQNRRLQTVYAMKEALQDIWRRSATTQENLLHALEEWCRQAEASGIRALRDFSQRLQHYALD